MSRDKDRVGFGSGGGSGGGGLGVATPMAVYVDDTVTVPGSPVLALDVQHPAASVDGIVCEVDAVITDQINILQDGLYQVLIQGDVFGVACTGGAVTLTVNLGSGMPSIAAKYNEGGISVDDTEYAAVWSEIWPVVAGGFFQAHLTVSGVATSKHVIIAIVKIG